MNSILLLTALLVIIGSLGIIVTILLIASMVALFLVRVPFVPTPKQNVQKCIEVLDLKPGETFYDIGCGDGRFIIEAAKKRANATGFEVSLMAYTKTKMNLLLTKSKANIQLKNFYRHNFSDANAVFCFLLNTVMPKVEKKLLAELPSGARVVSYGFTMPNWQPSKIVETNPGGKKSSKIYLYIKE